MNSFAYPLFLLAIFMCGMGCTREASLRSVMRRLDEVDTDALQEWAAEGLRDESISDGNPIPFSSRPWASPLRVEDAHAVKLSAIGPYAILSVRGGPHRIKLLVGSDGFEPEASSRALLVEYADGIWIEVTSR